jgi:hypothetical protein
MPRIAAALALIALFGIAGCARPVTGPAFAALPGQGKSYDQFKIDDAHCREVAMASIGGAGSASAAGATAQRSFDVAYAQCMTAAGNAVPNINPPPFTYAPYAYPYPPYVYEGPIGFGW